MADTKATDKSGEVTVEEQDTTVPTAGESSSKKELKAALTFKDDADLHPTGEPDSETEKGPGGPPATDPDRPPFATSKPDEAILSALATGAGEHTPPKAEE